MPSAKALKSVLLLEDEASFRDILQIGLSPEGFDIVAVGTLAEAKGILSERRVDAIVSDLRLTDGSGIELLIWMKDQGLEIPVVIMTAFATTETTVQALNLGAVDFLTKTKNDIQEITKVLKGIFAVSEPSVSGYEGAEIGELVGVGPTIRKIQALIGKVARVDATVLVTGESGTGKEVVARLIHRYSDRAHGPFVAVNCGALPENLLESELFGYEKGAFTGATGSKCGLFEEAAGGVLFLDEIGEIPLPLQVKLLRALQERRVRRLGDTRERAVDVRIICATNRDLRAQAESGKFREDLFYRVNILHLELPPLRERREDLPVLVDHFLARFARKLGKPVMRFSEDALELLNHYPFRGNVRELENLVERCVALNSGGAIGRDLFPDSLLLEAEGRSLPGARAASVQIPEAGFDLEAWLSALKGHLMFKALERAEQNRTRAARILGMSFRAYRYWLQELGGVKALPSNFPFPEDFPPTAAEENESEG